MCTRKFLPPYPNMCPSLFQTHTNPSTPNPSPGRITKVEIGGHAPLRTHSPDGRIHLHIADLERINILRKVLSEAFLGKETTYNADYLASRKTRKKSPPKTSPYKVEDLVLKIISPRPWQLPPETSYVSTPGSWSLPYDKFWRVHGSPVYSPKF